MKNSRQGSVYLLHFDAPFAHARHYLGFTTDLVGRLHDHDTGHGARLMAAIIAAGIGYRLARVWADRYCPTVGRDGFIYASKLEAKFKRGKASNRLCPICREKG